MSSFLGGLLGTPSKRSGGLRLVPGDLITFDGGRRIKVKKLLGEGAFSYVYLCKVKTLSGGRPARGTVPVELRYCALKRMTLQTEEQLKASKREIMIHRKLSGLIPNGVVALLEAQIQPLTGRDGPGWNEALMLFPWLPQSVRWASDI